MLEIFALLFLFDESEKMINFSKKCSQIKKYSIINLSSSGSKSYTFVIFIGSKVAFLQEGEDVTWCPFY